MAVSSGAVAESHPGLGAGGPPGRSGASRRVRTAVKNLRHQLGQDAERPTYIFNEPRVGYGMAKSGEQAREEERQGWERKPGPPTLLAFRFPINSWCKGRSATWFVPPPVEPRRAGRPETARPSCHCLPVRRYRFAVSSSNLGVNTSLNFKSRSTIQS